MDDESETRTPQRISQGLLTTLAIWATVFGNVPPVAAANKQSAPDALFLVVDDLNDWTSLLDPGAPIKKPRQSEKH
jgi:hypothetical protein